MCFANWILVLFLRHAYVTCWNLVGNITVVNDGFTIHDFAIQNSSIVMLIKSEITDKRLKSKVQSCKLYNSKYIIASTQITNTGSFEFMTVLLFKLLSRKVLFLSYKTGKTRKTVRR